MFNVCVYTFLFFKGPGSGSGVYNTCTKSFLFSLVNPGGTGPTKMALKADKTVNGIYCHSSYGPTFGSGHDLYISNAANSSGSSSSNLNNTYNCPPNQSGTTFLVGNQNFMVNEYEVFVYQK